jgi:hypothetical protein
VAWYGPYLNSEEEGGFVAITPHQTQHYAGLMETISGLASITDISSECELSGYAIPFLTFGGQEPPTRLWPERSRILSMFQIDGHYRWTGAAPSTQQIAETYASIRNHANFQIASPFGDRFAENYKITHTEWRMESAFLRSDYQECKTNFVDAAREKTLTLPTILLGLSAAFRSGTNPRPMANRIADQPVASWDRLLIKMIIGDLRPKAIESEAATDLNFCQFHLYAAIAAQNAVKYALATAHLNACVDARVDCWETEMAKSLLREDHD